MADAGRAMMLYRGLYDNTHTYEKLDVVNYNGSLYISTTDGNLGTEPTDGTKWKLFLQGGVADNIQATDTHGLVGEAGENSFVQLLLDSLASRVGKDGNGNVIEDTYLPKTAVLNTLEEIDANTSEENIAGALAIKSLKSNLTNSFDTLNSKLAITNYSRGDMDAELNSIDLERGIYILLTYHGFALDYNGLFYVINTGYSEPSKVVPIYQSDFLANMITLSVDYDNKKLIANRTPTPGAGSIKYNLYKFTNLHHFK